MKRKVSLTYRFLRALGFNYSEQEYGQISLWKVIAQFFRNIYHALLLSMMNWWFLEPFEPRMLRPFLLRRLGAKVGKGVFIGDHVWFDMNHSDLITIEDRVHIAGGCRLLCHQRDLSEYYKGSDYATLGYKHGVIILKKGCLLGMNVFVMPGVTIGEGSLVGVGSVVTKSIPDWCVAKGNPAKVVREIPEVDEHSDI